MPDEAAAVGVDIVAGADERVVRAVHRATASSSSEPVVLDSVSPAPSGPPESAEVIAKKAKAAAKPRVPHRVPGHVLTDCCEFEEVPTEKEATTCRLCMVDIPAKEAPERSSCRCKACAAPYCYQCAVSRLPADQKPTLARPLLQRLPPKPVEKPSIVSLSTLRSPFQPHASFVIGGWMGGWVSGVVSGWGVGEWVSG